MGARSRTRGRGAAAARPSLAGERVAGKRGLLCRRPLPRVLLGLLLEPALAQPRLTVELGHRRLLLGVGAHGVPSFSRRSATSLGPLGAAARQLQGAPSKAAATTASAACPYGGANASMRSPSPRTKT